MNGHAVELLAGSLIGPVPKAGISGIRGALLGIVAFLVFEFVSVINTNVPRVPVAWLMIVATIAIETVLFFRLIRFLRFPRTVDFMFIARLDYRQRIIVARHALRRVHAAFIPFTATVLAVAAVLEAAVLGERSLPVLFVVPAVCLLFMTLCGLLCRFAVGRRRITVARHDNTGGHDSFSGNSFFRMLLARYAVAVARRLSGWVGSPPVRVLLMRNLLYLLRGEIVLTLLLTVATPVLLFFLLLLLGDPWSPFVSLVPLVAVFMMNVYFTGELGEATDRLSGYHWISVQPLNVLVSNFFSLVIPASVVLPVYFAVTFPTAASPAGVIRVLSELIYFVVTVSIGAFRVTSRTRRDQDGVTDLLLFGGIAVGTFIPLAGTLFAFVVAGVLLLLNREPLRQTVRAGR